MSIRLEREIERVEDAQARDRAEVVRLCGSNPVCCIDCALGVAAPELRDRMRRRGLWLAKLQEKLAARGR